MRPLHLWLDQNGEVVLARTVKELREKAGGGAVSKMYRDTPKGTIHTGYVIGRRWFMRFAPVEKPV